MSAARNVTNNITHSVISKEGEAVYIVATSVLILFGIFLNGLLIAAYLTKRMDQSLFNFCLFNLSIVNISECLGFCPFVGFHIWKDLMVWEQGILGKIICGFTEGTTLFFIAVCVNASTVLYISILRYRMVVRVERCTEIRKSTRVMFAVFWFVAVLFMSPNLLRLNYSKQVGLCIRTFEIISEKLLMVWGGIMVTLFYFTPLVVILVTHCCILLSMYKSKNGHFKSQVKKRHRSRVILCLGITVIIFILCWTPWSVYWALSALGYFGNDLKARYFKTRIIKFVMIPCLCAGIFNIFAYVIVNVKLRLAMLSVITKKRDSQTTSVSTTSTD